jgi:hypothetical protein
MTVTGGCSAAPELQRKATAIANADRTIAPLVFVDCQFGLKEGKMKGSTKSRKMDEPFSFN